MTSASKTRPKLWEKVKTELLGSGKGGEPGQWSARKAQLAVQEYKRRGGGYEEDGPDRDQTDLNAWTQEEWGTKSGKDSLEDGERYLPKAVRMLLTEDEYRRSTSKKRADSVDGDAQFSDQPEDVRKKVARIKKDGPTKSMLAKRAADLDIPCRSSMRKAELLEAIDSATDENGRKLDSEPALKELSKKQLYEKAKDNDVHGRSSMSKSELIDALAD